MPSSQQPQPNNPRSAAAAPAIEDYYTIRKSTIKILTTLATTAVFLVGVFYTSLFLTPKEVHTVRNFFRDDREDKRAADQLNLAVWQGNIVDRLTQIEKQLTELKEDKQRENREIIHLLKELKKND